MKLIIISINQYKEKDAIVKTICPTGSLTLHVKALFDPKSPNSQLNAPLTIIDAEFVEGEYQYPILKRFKLLSSPMKRNNNYEYLSAILIIGELTNKIAQEEEYSSLYTWLYKAIECLDSTAEPWTALLVYTANLLRAVGYEFEVNSCVICGSKTGITSFSFQDGGFLCSSCLEETQKRDLTKNQMLLIRAAFNAKDFNLPPQILNKTDAIALMYKFYEFINDSFSTRINNILMLNK